MVSVGFTVTGFRHLIECRSVGAVGQALYDDRSVRATYKVIQLVGMQGDWYCFLFGPTIA